MGPTGLVEGVRPAPGTGMFGPVADAGSVAWWSRTKDFGYENRSRLKTGAFPLPVGTRGPALPGLSSWTIRSDRCESGSVERDARVTPGPGVDRDDPVVEAGLPAVGVGKGISRLEADEPELGVAVPDHDRRGAP
jgi:hypothetical protein